MFADKPESIQFQHGQESLLRHFDRTNLLHALLSFFLFFEQFAFTAYVTSITLGRHIFTHGFYRFPGYNLGSDGGLYGNVELLTGYQFFEFLAHAATEAHGIVGMGQGRQGIDRFSVEEYIEFDQFGRSEIV